MFSKIKNTKRKFLKLNFKLLITYTLFFNFTIGQNIHLKIKGLDSTSEAYLQNTKHQKTFKNLKELQEEQIKITKQLTHKGYFNYTTSPFKKINDSTFLFSIKLNQLFNSISITHHADFIKSIHLTPNTITKNQNITCPTIDLEQNLHTITEHLINSGKTFSAVSLKNIHIKNQMVYANLNIEETKTHTISNIIIKGYEKFPKKFIKHYLKLKPKQTLNTSLIEEKSLLLNNLLFSNELKKPQILFEKEATSVFLYPEKQKSNTFNGYIGFATNPETKKIAFNGNVNLKLINNLNFGEALHLKYLSTADDQKRININLKLPYIFNTPVSAETNIEIFKKDSIFSTNQQHIQLRYSIHQNITTGIGTRFTKSNTTNNQLNNIQSFNKTAYTLNFEHLVNQKNIFFKHKNRTLLELSTSKRISKNQNEPQQSIYINTAHILNLNKKNSIFIKNESYYLFSNNILENEKQYIGGINSIRGFQENSIPTHIYSYLNTEYRIQLNKTLYTHTIFDYGITKEKSTSNNLIGFGFGFGLKTNNNLLKFAFANQKTNASKIQFSNTQIHISLNTSF